MQVVKYKLGDVFPRRGCVLALGFFDGVHLGHRAILSYAVSEAERRGTLSAVFTFAYGTGLKNDSSMIYSERERELIFSELGIDICFVADFSDIRSLSPEEFVNGTVLGDIGAACACAGYDYRFGYRGEGSASLLSDLMRRRGGDALIFDALTFGDEPVSSTRVRRSLEAGNIEEANNMLGAPYFTVGSVEHGRGDGTGFGYPTVNILIEEGRAQLRYGVYLSAVKIGEKLYTGLTNVGECPSFGKRDYHTETYLLDFSGDLYGLELKVYFLSFIREERIFSSPEELARQIEKDKACAERIKSERYGELKI